MNLSRLLIPFVLVIVSFVGYVFWVGIPPEAGLAEKGQLGDSFGVLNSLFSGLGFAAVVVTIWMQQKQIKAQEKERIEEVDERRSLFNLNGALEAAEQARLLLSNHNNDRRTWIEAGRLLGHAKVLGEGVTVDCHQRVLEANKLKYRTFFSELLEHKSAAFFYGVDSMMTTTDAARASSAPANSRFESETRLLEEASIYRIWEAAQWPADFDDPVGQKFTPEERERLIFRAQGLREFLDHKDEHISIGGELRRRSRQAL